MIASTHRDLHGERLSREGLEQLFTAMPRQRLMNYNHDPLCPRSRAFNNRLERLGDGEYTIRSDIEVLDEELFPKAGGVSIAYTRVPIAGARESPIPSPSSRSPSTRVWSSGPVSKRPSPAGIRSRPRRRSPSAPRRRSRRSS